jgi:hypothetical protein
MNWINLLAVGLLLSVSLSIALAATARATPAVNSVNYIPLLPSEGGPPLVATPTASPTALPTSTPTPSATPTATPLPGQPFSLSVTEQLQWYKPGAPGGNYDIVIVQDYTQSMRGCWDPNSPVACNAANKNRRIDYVTPTLRSFVDEMLVKRNSAALGGDNRLALVTFGHYTGTLSVAKTRIPFGTDTAATVTKFQQLYGTAAAPISVLNSELTGQSNTAAGLVKAQEVLAAHRSVDKYGKPVSLAVLLITDGTANVFNDGGMQGIANAHTQAPFYCGAGVDGLENPLVQWVCPGPAALPSQRMPQPPIKAMVAAANALRVTYPSLEIFAVVLGENGGLTPSALHLNEVAPSAALMAATVPQLPAVMDGIEENLATPCQNRADARRPAVGAQVTIRTTDGVSVASGLVDASGTFSTTLAPGQYTVEAQHLNVVSPNDPLSIAHSYTSLQPGWTSQSGAASPFTMPSQPLSSYAANLAIDSPANGGGPTPLTNRPQRALQARARPADAGRALAISAQPGAEPLAGPGTH